MEYSISEIEKRIEVLDLSKLGAEEQLIRTINEKFLIDNYSRKVVELALEIKKLDDKISELSSIKPINKKQQITIVCFKIHEDSELASVVFNSCVSENEIKEYFEEKCGGVHKFEVFNF